MFITTLADDMLCPRSFAGTIVLQEKVFLVGGCDRNGLPLSVFDVFDANADTAQQWTALPDLPTKKAATIVIGDGNTKLYSLGGICNANDPLKEFEMFDCSTQQWMTLAPLPQPTQSFSLFWRKNKLFAVGGKSGNVVLNTLQCYDPVRDKWHSFCPMQNERYASSMIYDEQRDLLYVLGGRTKAGITATVEVFEFRSLRWRSTVDDVPGDRVMFPIQHLLHSVSSPTELDIRPQQRDLLFLSGGCKGNVREGLSKHCRIFDASNETWLKGPPLLKGRADAIVGCIDDNVVIAGGIGENGCEKNFDYLSVHFDQTPNTWSWHEGGSLQKPHVTCPGVSYNDQVILFGGITKDGLSPTVEIIRLAT